VLTAEAIIDFEGRPITCPYCGKEALVMVPPHMESIVVGLEMCEHCGREFLIENECAEAATAVKLLNCLRRFSLHHCFQFGFDFDNSLSPSLMLRHFIFGVVFVRKMQTIVGSNLIEVGAKAGDLL
jgi:DNA-directed RNA polymerase subunit RPC12/RpoP